MVTVGAEFVSTVTNETIVVKDIVIINHENHVVFTINGETYAPISMYDFVHLINRF